MPGTRPFRDLVNGTKEEGPDWQTALASGGRKGKVQSLLVTGMAAHSAYSQLKGHVETYRNKRNYTISVSDADPVFPMLSDWIVSQLPHDKRRSLKAVTAKVRDPDDEFATFHRDGSVRPTRKVFLIFDGQRRQEIWLKGHKVKIHTDEDNIASADRSGVMKKAQNLVLTAQDRIGQNVVLDLLQEFANRLDVGEKAENTINVATKWGAWEEIGGRQVRPLETVVLNGGIRDIVIDDMSRFFDAEDRYVKMGLPWHRGYLLHGPPGTGKTSMATAIAGYFGLDVYFLPLKDVSSDKDLIKLVSYVSDRSMLLIEDIDIIKASNTREDVKDPDSEGLSMQGLLNVLDGIVTPHGLVMVMTTNKPDVLDNAITREGRVDRSFEIGYLVGDQPRRLVEALLGRDPGVLPNVDGYKVTPAQLVEVIKTHMFLSDDEIIGKITDYLEGCTT